MLAVLVDRYSDQMKLGHQLLLACWSMCVAGVFSSAVSAGRNKWAHPDEYHGTILHVLIINQARFELSKEEIRIEIVKTSY